MRFHLLAALASLSLALGLSACGGGSSSSSPSQETLPQTVPQSNSAISSTGFASTNWQVQAGASTFNQAFQDLDFYSNQITINAGDTVSWRIASLEPHTVAFLLPGQPFPPDGSPAQLAPSGGTVIDGTKFVNSGLLNGGQTVTFSFPKPGTYIYYCLLHPPEMSGTIVVQKAGTPYPHTQGFYVHEGSVDEWLDLNAAENSLKLFPFTPNGTTLTAGISPNLNHPPVTQSTVLRFLRNSSNNLDQVTTIPVNTTVTWKNETNNEPHTVTLPVAGQPLPNVPPFIPPAGGPTYDGSTFTNSGVIPPGGSYSLKFIKKGSFLYYCLFHAREGMWARITVI